MKEQTIDLHMQLCKLYDGNVLSIHKNIKKDRGTKNKFRTSIFLYIFIVVDRCLL